MKLNFGIQPYKNYQSPQNMSQSYQKLSLINMQSDSLKEDQQTVEANNNLLSPTSQQQYSL